MRPLSRSTLAAAAAATLLATAACSPQPAPVGPVAAASAPHVTDIHVTEHVKTALLQSAALQGAEIAVATVNGDVRLTGVLATQGQVDEALRIARAADGAHAIHDELTLRPPGPAATPASRAGATP